MRRKRQKRFTWMPTLGTNTVLAEPPDTVHVSGRAFGLDVLPTASGTYPGGQGSINTLIFPVIPDTPLDAGESLVQSDPANAGLLALTLGTEWFCERITGHLFVAYRAADIGQVVPASVLVTAGFFVARCNDAGSGGGPGQPIGSASSSERVNNYSAMHLDAIREPWMWRKSWMLGGAPNVTDGFSLNPTTNAFYGSIADGPKVEVKSVRRIGQDDRLFFSISTCALRQSSSEEVTFTGGVQGYLDVRVLGNTRKAKGTGKF